MIETIRLFEACPSNYKQSTGRCARMMTHLISLTALAVRYGFAWHNQSARQLIRLKVKAKREKDLRSDHSVS
jgi:hypothetical protein